MSTLPRALQAEPGQLWAGPSQMQGWRRLQPTAPAHDRVRLKVCPRRRADYRTLTWRGQGCGGAEGHPADPAHPPGPWTGDPCPGCVPRGSGPLGLSGGSWPPADQPTEGGVLSCVHAGGGRRPAEDSPPPGRVWLRNRCRAFADPQPSPAPMSTGAAAEVAAGDRLPRPSLAQPARCRRGRQADTGQTAQASAGCPRTPSGRPADADGPRLPASLL